MLGFWIIQTVQQIAISSLKHSENTAIRRYRVERVNTRDGFAYEYSTLDMKLLNILDPTGSIVRKNESNE